jgi:NDP-sugar pyrophosphorylase family protein
MLGMVLCGGHGKRLRPLTDEIPKTLIEIKEGYTILDKQLIDLRNAGMCKVILLTGYLSNKIEERYGQKWKGIDILYSQEEKPLGTLNAINLGLKNVDEDVIVRNGDVVADVNMKKMINKFNNSNYMASMLVAKMRSPYGIVDIGDDRIKKFREKPILDYYFNAGIYCFRKGITKMFENFDTGDIEKSVFPLLAETNQFGFFKNEGLFWISVDTTKDLEEVQKEYNNKTDKPWGYEKVLINTEKYITKELFIFEGYQTSFHYHEHKDETMYIMEGTGYIEFDDHKQHFVRNDAIRIEPNIPHTIVATENTVLHEISTPHMDDTVRIKDFYKRNDN